MSGLAGGAPGGGAISLGDLIALNDEIAALARAGLPLERGLREVGEDVSGGLRSAMVALSARMERGASLAEALAEEGGRFPPVYRAVVEAGVRGGRLPLALESLAGFIRAYVEARRTIGLALWYPLIVLCLAYALFVLMVTQIVPRFLGAFESLRVPVPMVLGLLARLGETAAYWGPVVPGLVVAGGVWWAWTGRASSFGAKGPLRWLPWMRSMLALFEAANFAQLLAILIEHGVPYPDAVVLASEASGDAALRRAGREVARGAGGGDAGHLAERRARGLPPLLRWLLASAGQQGALALALRQAATVYRRRALHQADKIRVYLPIVLLFAVGVTATLAYTLTLFVPLAALLRGLAAPRP